MVLLPPAEPSEANVFKTFASLTFSQTQSEHVNNNCRQPIYSSSTPTNNNINSLPQNNNVQPNNQSTVILQQFSITQELRNYTDKVSDDITKIKQACTTA